MDLEDAEVAIIENYYKTVFCGHGIGKVIPPIQEQIVELNYKLEVLSIYQATTRELGKNLIIIKLENEFFVV